MNPIVQPILLEGKRVRLEPLTLGHLPALLELAQLEDYPLTVVPNTEAGMQKYIEAALEGQSKGSMIPFVTVDKNPSPLGRGAGVREAVVGSTRFGNIEFWPWPESATLARPGVPDAAEIGWTWLAPQAQRSGINTEAKLLMLAHAFEFWQVRRMTLKTDERNMRSRNAIARLGANFDGILRGHMPASDGGIRNTAIFSILAEEWPAVKARLEGFLAR